MEKETKRKEEEIKVLIDMQKLFMICIIIVNTYYLNLNLKLELLLKCILFIGIANFFMKCMKY